MEEWREKLIDFERYIINENGTVWSKHYKRNLGSLRSDGYIRVSLCCIDGKKREYLIHRVIAYFFIPNPDNKPEVDHINTIRTDNRVENLRWYTSGENSNNPITLEKNKKAQPKRPVLIYKDDDFIGEFESSWEASRILNINQGNVYNCACGRCKTTEGYKVYFKE